MQIPRVGLLPLLLQKGNLHRYEEKSYNCQFTRGANAPFSSLAYSLSLPYFPLTTLPIFYLLLTYLSSPFHPHFSFLPPPLHSPSVFFPPSLPSSRPLQAQAVRDE